MDIRRLPAVASFCSDDESRQAVLRIGEEGGKAVYTFTVLTPHLVRMRDWNVDNKVSLFLDGKWESFTPSGLSTIDGASVHSEILENNNKRSRYRIRIEIAGHVPASIQAMAETLVIS